MQEVARRSNPLRAAHAETSKPSSDGLILTGTWGWTVGVAVDTGLNLVRSTFHFFTLSIFKSKPKIE